jgi:RNA polymerase sigma-70 factor (ECF subfamily)
LRANFGHDDIGRVDTTCEASLVTSRGTTDAAIPDTPSGLTRIAREHALADRVRAGDADALAALYATYRPALLAIARGYVDHADDAADVVQEVFVAIWRRRAEFAPAGPVAAYLFVAVRHRAISALRRSRRVRPLVARDDDRADADAGALGPTAFNSGEARVLRPDLERAVEAAIEALPERCRAVYRLHRDAQLSYAEIGAALGIAPATVRVQLIKAWNRVAARLDAEGWSNVLRRQGQ